MNKHLNPLIEFLGHHFSFHHARVKCLAGFIASLLKSKRVNLVHLSQVYDSKVKTGSVYRRLQRFLSGIIFDSKDLAKAIVSLMGLYKEEKWTLILDRTNWKFGVTHINILYLAIAHKGMSIPLFFSFLEDKKRGNSDHIDRIDLLESFVSTFGNERVGVLLGDREFIGGNWIHYLMKHKIPYTFRMKEKGQKIASSRGKMTLICQLLHSLKPGHQVHLGKRKISEKNSYTANISGLRNEKGELMVVMHSEEVQDPLGSYSQRWEIETMFKAFKSNGFNLEETHITDPDRIMTLLGVLSLAFCFAFQKGVIIVAENPQLMRLKKHGSPPKSIFRIGIDHFQNLFANIFNRVKALNSVFRSILKPTIGANYSNKKSFVM